MKATTTTTMVFVQLVAAAGTIAAFSQPTSTTAKVGLPRPTTATRNYLGVKTYAATAAVNAHNSNNDNDNSPYHNHNGWSVADDWDALSSENPVNSAPDSSTLFNQDIAKNAAKTMEKEQEVVVSNEEDIWLNDVIEEIIQTPLSSTPLYDTLSSSFEAVAGGTATTTSSSKTRTATAGNKNKQDQQKAFEEQMGDEIARLVRCNESPEDLLVRAGRAMPELTLEQKQDVGQLLVWKEPKKNGNDKRDRTCWHTTRFFNEAITKIFQAHAVAAAPAVPPPPPTENQEDNNDKQQYELFMDARAISRWMTRSIGTELESYTQKDTSSSTSAAKNKKGSDMTSLRTQKIIRIGPHDSRVLKLLTKYSTYGTGKLTLENLKQVYLDALTHNDHGMALLGSVETLQLRNQEKIRQVWRDFRNHGIIGPNEDQWNNENAKLQARYGGSLHQQNQQILEFQERFFKEDFMDECEILDLSYDPPPTSEQLQLGHDEKNHKYIRKSSYEQVRLAADGTTPLYMEEGEFVFIDEESCIGCMQCVNAAPASFLMLENGRARTFHQRQGPDVRQGVAACPVNCMHLVSFDELKELEDVRDKGDGRDDHRHMGHRRGHTPLYVAGMDSDNNHRSSWYHHIKNKCCSDGRCPQRGCFDCPSYTMPGGNPYFKEKAKEKQHVRAQHFLDHGDVDLWRKTVDL